MPLEFCESCGASHNPTDFEICAKKKKLTEDTKRITRSESVKMAKAAVTDADSCMSKLSIADQ